MEDQKFFRRVILRVISGRRFLRIRYDISKWLKIILNVVLCYPPGPTQNINLPRIVLYYHASAKVLSLKVADNLDTCSCNIMTFIDSAILRCDYNSCCKFYVKALVKND